MNALRVLVVEDEPIVAMFLEDILESIGCETVGPAARLCEGLDYAGREPLGAAILDINLGEERSTAIAELLRSRGVPFAFASGYDNVPEGFGDTVPLIPKPYRQADIAAVLRMLVG
jgi:DNA-binding response OmpR family regulator